MEHGQLVPALVRALPRAQAPAWFGSDCQLKGKVETIGGVVRWSLATCSAWYFPQIETGTPREEMEGRQMKWGYKCFSVIAFRLRELASMRLEFSTSCFAFHFLLPITHIRASFWWVIWNLEWSCTTTTILENVTSYCSLMLRGVFSPRNYLMAEGILSLTSRLNTLIYPNSITIPIDQWKCTHTQSLSSPAHSIHPKVPSVNSRVPSNFTNHQNSNLVAPKRMPSIE